MPGHQRSLAIMSTIGLGLMVVFLSLATFVQVSRISQSFLFYGSMYSQLNDPDSLIWVVSVFCNSSCLINTVVDYSATKKLSYNSEWRTFRTPKIASNLSCS